MKREELEKAIRESIYPRLGGDWLEAEEDKAVFDIMAAIDQYTAQQVVDEPECKICAKPIATGDCQHIRRVRGQIRMSHSAWLHLTDELSYLRGFKANIDDASIQATLTNNEEQHGN